MIFDLIDAIGYRGPILLFFMTILSIRKQEFYLYTYIIFYFVNELLKNVLKTIIKQKRPYGNNIYEETPYGKYDIHGMPSGHAQSSFFSLAFSHCVTGSYYLFIIELFICFTVLYQRWNKKRHSLEQLGIGSLIGSLFAIFVYYSVDYIWRTMEPPKGA